MRAALGRSPRGLPAPRAYPVLGRAKPVTQALLTARLSLPPGPEGLKPGDRSLSPSLRGGSLGQDSAAGGPEDKPAPRGPGVTR